MSDLPIRLASPTALLVRIGAVAMAALSLVIF
jgi:hypothetical protein